jgi:hypothetical protein
MDRLRAWSARKAAARRGTATEPAPAGPAESTSGEPAGEDGQEPADAAEPVAAPPDEPRVVRRIVWAYEAGVLPGSWLMGCKRLKALLERAGFGIRVDMLPLTELPVDADVVFVPEALDEAARAAAPAARVIALAGRPEQEVFDALVAELRAGTELTAPPSAAASDEGVDAPGTAPRGTVVRYRGWERID